jgi:putative transposase
MVPKQSTLPYHISARCINREWFKIPINEVWEIFEDCLFVTKHQFKLSIHAFVLMSNHFHLLVSAPEANISQAMEYFMREVSRQITKRAGRINQTWGGRHNKTLIESFHDFQNAYKYVYRNPVEARLCKRVEEYSYSTLSGLLGFKRLIIPLEEDAILFGSSVTSIIVWLNTAPQTADRDALKKALRRGVFKLPVERNRCVRSRLKTELL